MGRIFVVRVGADTQYYPIRSPIFVDERFELVPITEGEKKMDQLPIAHRDPMQRYCDIRCFNTDAAPSLGAYVGKEAQTVAHNDPEFAHMTYGDLCDLNPRARNLIDDPRTERKGAEQGDYLFFLARLEGHDGRHFTGKAGLYFVGYFHIEARFGPIQAPLTNAEEASIGRNAHILRAKAEPDLWVDERRKFWVFKGGPDSVRFRFALEADWEWLSTVFSDAYGRPWHETKGQTLMQRAASYTRTIRCHLDPDNPEQSDYYRRFWDKVHDHLKRRA